MDSISKGRDRHEGNFDLSQKWLRHLRESAKSVVTLYNCPFCRDKKVLPDFDALYNHVLLEHANQAPPKEDREKTEKFKESLRAQTTTPTTPRSVYSNFFLFLFVSHPPQTPNTPHFAHTATCLPHSLSSPLTSD